MNNNEIIITSINNLFGVTLILLMINVILAFLCGMLREFMNMERKLKESYHDLWDKEKQYSERQFNKMLGLVDDIVEYNKDKNNKNNKDNNSEEYIGDQKAI